MSGDAWRERLHAYVDGELAEADLRSLEEHLQTCRECAAEALNRMQMKRAVRAAGTRFAPSAEFRQRVLTAYE